MSGMGGGKPGDSNFFGVGSQELKNEQRKMEDRIKEIVKNGAIGHVLKSLFMDLVDIIKETK